MYFPRTTTEGIFRIIDAKDNKPNQEDSNSLGGEFFTIQL